MPAQSFSTAVLQDQLNDPANNALANLTVTVTPTATVTSTSQPVQVTAKAQVVYTDTTGLWKVTIPQSFSGAAEYIVSYQGLQSFRVSIPAGAGPFIASQNKATDSQ